ncbi:MFS general substrate transporter [Aspergillus steynii IBT 23096]|uniref:MFS general substrate transporter n=1 Tax=Aspergillus steynii IBT 23096 TaxID=1392250 RepID=A0A2I2FWK4_9EURO|nr:MFS general substrate transporter [Aspergillus steynii IBT 23096]PLB44946.1 MFS general substrate transporter [Aspergillus steynii IBT 23096]
MSLSRSFEHDIQNEVSSAQCANVVDWDGPDDEANPLNWKRSLKITTVAIVSVFNFLTPLGSAMFAPGVQEVMDEFQSTSQPMSSFVVSVYLLGFAFGPLIVAPLSEIYGRLPLYHGCNTLFILSNVACALAPSLPSLVGFRFLAGSAGCAPLALGAGTLADVITPERRGLAISIWAVGPVIGPVVGPVCGGFLTQNVSWRWVFWVIAIAGGVSTGVSFILLRETYAPIILARKTRRLARDTGNTDLQSALHRDLSPIQLFATTIIRPLKMLLFSPIVSLLSWYVAVVYGFLYLLFTTMSKIYREQYHFSASIVGLTYIGLGLGSAIGLLAMGMFSDKLSNRLATASKSQLKPEFRLSLMIPLALCMPIGLVWYGWTADKKAHWILPIIGTCWVGVGVVVSFTGVQAYLVDAFTTQAASAAAANTVLRSLMGAVLPLAGPSMYNTLGVGWGNTLLAFVGLVMLPLPLIFFKYGEKLRMKYPCAS